MQGPGRNVPFAGTARFEVRARIGEGGGGAVYRVHDRELGKEVALKAMLRPGPGRLGRLKREFRSRAGLTHPNLLQLYELFVEDDLCFFTMELLEGTELDAWSRGGLPLTLVEGSLPAETTREMLSPTRTLTEDHPPLASARAPRRRARAAPPSTEELHRIRHGLVQLVHGLHALHAIGKVHRDVKPSNVLVCEGRVVLLDFGLVADISERGPSRGRWREVAGTPAYMAPEQLLGQPLTPAADFYAVGVMLYEALTGVLPWGDARGTLLARKTSVVPLPPGALVEGVPNDLADLALDLLALDPRRRPGVTACVARLTGERAALVPESRGERLFVGREVELGALAEALDAVVDQGKQVTLHLHGPSGIGKSTLVRQFLAADARLADAVVLAGRCHPHESVPYEALDAVVDALARWLGSLPEAEMADLLPPRSTALGRLFPVLEQVPEMGREPVLADREGDLDLRQQGASALRELFARIAARAPLVVWIDDLQWGDVDSLPLLDELLRPPAPPFLLVCAYRSEERVRSPLLRLLLERDHGARDLPLGALAEAEAEALAGRLLDRASPGVEATPRVVASLSEGNPFIVCELARHLAALGDRASATLPERVDVTRLLVDRIEALPPGPRALLEVAATAGQPIDRSLALDAAGLAERDRTMVGWLSDAYLLREVSGEDAPAVAPYHDRIREAVIQSMPAERRRGRHRGLAEALTRRTPDDLEALFQHWEGAGERRRAGEYAVRAADRAARALAFDNAAALYEKSLDLLGPAADRPALLEKLGATAAARGLAPLAARHYLDAAAALGGDLAHRRVGDLRRRAAEQYLKSGRVDEGWREMRAILAAERIPVAGSFAAAMGAAAWRRLVFLIRRRDVEERGDARPLPAEQRRLDVLWAASTSWSMMNPALADSFRIMHLRAAVATGDASTVCRALAFEAAAESHLGGALLDRSARGLLDEVARLAARTGDPYDRAWHALARANVAWTHGRWRETAEACERADRIFHEQCPGTAWERVAVAIFHHHALAMLGDLRRLWERLLVLQREARLRGDVHALCEAHVNDSILAWMAVDRAPEARAHAVEALAAQRSRASTWPEAAYRRLDYADLVAHIHASLHRGDPWPAWTATLAQWPSIKAAFFLQLRGTGLSLRHARVRAALAAASTLADARSAPPAGVDPRWTRAALCADVAAQVAVIARDPIGCARPIAALARAALAHLSRNDTEAEHELERAIAGFGAQEMALHRESARYALGELAGGRRGAAAKEAASAWMSEQGIARPRAMVAALAPGLGVEP